MASLRECVPWWRTSHAPIHLGTQAMQATTLSMSASEAFAAIPLAAVCCDQTFGKE